jgi:hypothetical protein
MNDGEILLVYRLEVDFDHWQVNRSCIENSHAGMNGSAVDQQCGLTRAAICQGSSPSRLDWNVSIARLLPGPSITVVHQQMCMAVNLRLALP